MSEQLFSVAGIVTDEKGRTKVRYCNDLVGRVKLFTKNTQNKRVDFVELPNPMAKVDAINYLLTHATFASNEDQSLLKDSLVVRSPKAKRVVKEKTVKVSAKNKSELSLDKIRARKKKVTAEEVLAVISTIEDAPV